MANRAEKRFGLTNHRITVLGIKFGSVVTDIEHDPLNAATRRLRFQRLENAPPVVATRAFPSAAINLTWASSGALKCKRLQASGFRAESRRRS